MKINCGKSHMLFLWDDAVSANIDNNVITSENKSELPRIVLDSNFSFEDPINNVCKKASQKLNALARIVVYIYQERKKNYESTCNTPIWMLSFSFGVL